MSPLRDALGGAAHAWRRLRYRRALARQRVPVPRGEVRVSYGQVLPPAPGAAVRGGRVKLLQLQEAFPESPDAFNLLYLVSSAQPPFADELARWARSRGIKVVWNQDGVAYPAWAGRHAAGLNATMRAAMRHAHHVLYQSEFCRASAGRFLGRARRAGRGPAELRGHRLVPSRRRAPSPATPWTLLAAGSHQHRSRVVRAIEVAVELRRRGQDVRLVVAGLLDWDDAAADIARTVRDLGAETLVETLPPYTQREAPAIFQRAHVLLHLKYKDPCPTVVIEALACGVPGRGVAERRAAGAGRRRGRRPPRRPGLLGRDPRARRDGVAADAVTRMMEDHDRWREAARRRAERASPVRRGSPATARSSAGCSSRGEGWRGATGTRRARSRSRS